MKTTPSEVQARERPSSRTTGTELQRFRYDCAIDSNGTKAADYKNGHVRRVSELDGSVVEYDY